MTKSELIEQLAEQFPHVPFKDLETSVKELLEYMAQSLSKNDRIEIRGFGSFSLHYRAPRVGRNPKTGDSVELTGKYVPHFKPGKELRDRVNL
ncbi:integration host factor subunit beta [Saccharobesus litoralis]|uniref:Integration host factor subunit beta n=1 Tax=Saccharobesus litoralis TaxID=2172099 RepID=A0A2S0VP38_9ALTE|nr:integration host factor subunit beta [Saccharobesus litoralis]AWB65952.1 integration host factor subunit beta [Saccharobesus litoralis]